MSLSSEEVRAEIAELERKAAALREYLGEGEAPASKRIVYGEPASVLLKQDPVPAANKKGQRLCSFCKRPGHIARKCPNAEGVKGGAKPGVSEKKKLRAYQCSYCHQPGHTFTSCPARVNGSGKPGHMAAE